MWDWKLSPQQNGGEGRAGGVGWYCEKFTLISKKVYIFIFFLQQLYS